jgi:thiol-disulfide isomerase/thioredoxin
MININFKSGLITSSLFLALLFTGCDKTSQDNVDNVSQVNSMVVDNNFHLTDLKGNSYTIVKSNVNGVNGFVVKEHPNKIIIFDIFATWCPPCQQEAVHLSNLQKKYNDDLLILGVTIEDDIVNSKLANFAKQYHADYPLVNSKDNQKTVHAVASATKVGSQFPIPLMVMYKDGKYITHYVGATPQEMIDSDISRLLKEAK